MKNIVFLVSYCFDGYWSSFHNAKPMQKKVLALALLMFSYVFQTYFIVP